MSEQGEPSAPGEPDWPVEPAPNRPTESLIPHHLAWPGCRNARDVGGMPTADGRRTRRRALVRSDSHCHLTAEGEALLRAYGVSRVIDLRMPEECRVWPSRLGDDPMYQNLPVLEPDAGPRPVGVGDTADAGGRSDGSEDRRRSTAESYMAILDDRPARFAAVLAAIAEAPSGTVVVQCAAGKDRTGIVVALALALAGVEHDRIAWDYELTDERLRAYNDAMLAGVVSEDERAAWRSIRHARAETMHRVLRHLDDRYGGAAGYLTSGGLTAGQAATLVTRLVG